MLKKLIKRSIVKLVKLRPYPSETSKCRARLAGYCRGYGLDIGPGGDPITSHAIRVDLESPYSSVGRHPVQLGGDASDLVWFRDKAFDFVYSSHVLEDFIDTGGVLREWLRVIKEGGSLVLYCPDEQRFRAHCQKTGQPYNPAHKLPHFSFNWVKSHLEQIDPTGHMIHSRPQAEIYSWDLVWQRGHG
jgi:SAM-dependent methyltransferase